MANDVIDIYEDDLYLSDHSQSMRRACDYCIKLFRRLGAETDANTDANVNANTKRIKLRSILRKGYPGSDDLHLRGTSKEQHRQRTDAYCDFWDPTKQKTNSSDVVSDSVSVPPNEHTATIKMETIQVELVINNDAYQKISPAQVRSFKHRFQNLNVPCLITGLDQSPHFQFVNQHWRNQSGNEPKDSLASKTTSSKIHREWFQKDLGVDFLVPLRYSPLGEEGGGPGSQLSLDEDGRAMECETKEVPVKDWISMLEASHRLQQKSGGDAKNHRCCNGTVQATVCEGEQNETIYYLKDWHLQQRYTSPANESTNEDWSPRIGVSFDGSSNPDCSLYKVPEFFGRDLLNSFLTRFTKGDYRFCYWGPSRSFTARHSDVMHSFSWSYNVVGTKEWTFYHSNTPGADSQNKNVDESVNECKTFTVTQETGQTIFVPATWQHDVVNLEETISINHNWITSANIDLVWDCLKVEMVAIQTELKGWACGNDDDGLDQNAEACENMLRGCIGLDVTGFVLMALVGLLEAVMALVSMPLPKVESTPGSSSSKSCNQTKGVVERAIFSTKQEELMFDVIRLAWVLKAVSTMEKHLVRFRSRLSAVLQSNDMAQMVESMVEDLIDCIQIS